MADVVTSGGWTYKETFINDRAAQGLPPYRVWITGEVTKLMKMVDRGVPRAQIAEKFNVSTGAINAMVFRIRHGLPVGPKPRRKASK